MSFMSVPVTVEEPPLLPLLTGGFTASAAVQHTVDLKCLMQKKTLMFVHPHLIYLIYVLA